MTAGHIRKRGKTSWELKFEGTPAILPPASARSNTHPSAAPSGRRRRSSPSTSPRSARGPTSSPARSRSPSTSGAGSISGKAASDISPRTAERYRELLDHQIAPDLGDKQVQKLTTVDIESWHAALRPKVSARTIGHAHRILSHALRDGVRHGLLVKNVASLEGAPKVDAEDVQVVPKERLGDLIDKLRGRAIYPRAITALFTGLRRGEVLALRWDRVDLDAKLIRVCEALEETKAHGLRVKATKTKAGRRDVTLPETVVEAFREHQREQLELRMALGMGKMPEDALVFPAPLKGGYQSPRAFSKEWARVAASIGFDGISFHA